MRIYLCFQNDCFITAHESGLCVPLCCTCSLLLAVAWSCTIHSARNYQYSLQLMYYSDFIDSKFDVLKVKCININRNIYILAWTLLHAHKKGTEPNPAGLKYVDILQTCRPLHAAVLDQKWSCVCVCVCVCFAVHVVNAGVGAFPFCTRCCML